MNKILIVEDNELNRDMLSRRLVRKGFEVHLAMDGLQGLEVANEQKPDLILMDLSLPVLDGWEATRRLKADRSTCGIPVIALTAHAMAEDRKKALDAGCDDFDTKPVDLDRLLAKMSALLSRQQEAASSPAKPANEFMLAAVPASLDLLNTELERLCRQSQVTDDFRTDLLIVLDEIVANICTHAYANQTPGQMIVTFHHEASQIDVRAAVSMSFTDWGPAFNPLDQATPQLLQSLEDRVLGGMGIHLVRQLTDSQSYQRLADGSNELTVKKFIN